MLAAPVAVGLLLRQRASVAALPSEFFCPPSPPHLVVGLADRHSCGNVTPHAFVADDFLCLIASGLRLGEDSATACDLILE
eukprot:14754751-Alexandrium_andersonii.AAC.1